MKAGDTGTPALGKVYQGASPPLLDALRRYRKAGRPAARDQCRCSEKDRRRYLLSCWSEDKKGERQSPPSIPTLDRSRLNLQVE